MQGEFKTKQNKKTPCHYGPNFCTHRKIKAQNIYAKYLIMVFEYSEKLC